MVLKPKSNQFSNVTDDMLELEMKNQVKLGDLKWLTNCQSGLIILYL